MARIKIDGGWTALVTPFTEDGSVDWKGFEKNIKFQIAEGISGILAVGTSGESPTLNWEEHNEVIKQASILAKDKCHSMAGSGSNCTNEALQASEEAVRAGTDSILLVDCYYNGPSSLELREEYHGVVAKNFPETTVVPYIIPGRTGTAMGAVDMAILAQTHPNVSAVKEATGDIKRMIKTRELTGENFDIVSGDDDMTFEMMENSQVKASGVISVISNIVPAAVEKMCRHILNGDIEEGRRIRDALEPLFSIVTVKCSNERVLKNGETIIVEDKFRNPLAIKTLMNMLGMPAGLCRRPLGKMTSAGIKIVKSAVQTVWDKNPEVLRPIEETYKVDINKRLEEWRQK